MYPKKTDADVRLFQDCIEIQFGKIHKNKIIIPYRSIPDLSNEDEKRITKTRAVLLGITVIGIIPDLLWKKRFVYTVIEYTDELGIKQTVIVDFHRNAERAQQSIYGKMIEARSK